MAYMNLFSMFDDIVNVTPQKLDLDFSAEKGEPRWGSRTVIRTTVYHPHCGSHLPRSGGPRSPSRAVDHHISYGKACGYKVEPPGLRHQTTEPSTGRGLDDGLSENQ
ncbi:hypothetical protein MTR67_019247 [Solanum verrucosum]|uniref:Uncharacterized protein n=1 Tax=Solanum verrucosum TaxID=315347 RepID=A0AAF0QNE3_SOLVR|nr:hypothetical protein MTR67_019247 [Solanum verrucosum]